MVGWSGDQVAWLASAGYTSNGKCPPRITDVSRGAGAFVAPPPGYAGYLTGGAFSPAGAQALAAFVYNPSGGEAAVHLVLASLTTTGTARPR